MPERKYEKDKKEDDKIAPIKNAEYVTSTEPIFLSKELFENLGKLHMKMLKNMLYDDDGRKTHC